MNIYGQHLYINTNGGAVPVFAKGKESVLKLTMENQLIYNKNKERKAREEKALNEAKKHIALAKKNIEKAVKLDGSGDLPVEIYDFLMFLDEL